MRESIKTSLYSVTIWIVIFLLCIITFYFAREAIEQFLALPKAVTLEDTAATPKKIKPTGKLYVLSSIVEDFVMSNDTEVQKILTSFGYNLSQNKVSTSEVNCSEDNIKKLEQDKNQGWSDYIASGYQDSTKYQSATQSLDRCKTEIERRKNEADKVFVITLSEKCGFYIDFSKKEDAPQISLDEAKQLKISYSEKALKLDCMPQKIQFLSNNEEYWAKNADDRVMDKIKEMLEKSVKNEFKTRYKDKAAQNADKTLTSLFCAMNYKNIVINGSKQPCPSK